jgi:hypothetical protein
MLQNMRPAAEGWPVDDGDAAPVEQVLAGTADDQIVSSEVPR